MHFHLKKFIPICLEMKGRKLAAFGSEATTKYLELCETNEHEGWYLFERFKMALFVQDAPLDKDIEIEEILEKKLKAIDVFTEAIKYIKTEVISALRHRTILDTTKAEVKSEADIHWVLTVPAIWNDLSKKFMRDAAINAGIPSEVLTLALEPEVASLFCKKQLRYEDSSGRRYIVLDLGGGTADITIHEVNPDGTLKEIHQPMGGDFGGTSVDQMFVRTLIQVFGAPAFQNFKKNSMCEYKDLMQKFEEKKCRFDGQNKIRIKFPSQLSEIFVRETNESFESSLRQTHFENDINLVTDKMVLSVKLVKSFFDDAIDKIVRLINDLLNKVSGIDDIVLVGGFSESKYLQTVMRSTFGNKIIIPSYQSSAVQHGAVIYGYEQKGIASRVCKYTYGIARMMEFKSYHLLSKRVTIDGVDFCDDIFYKHIEIGTTVNVADAQNVEAHEYFPSQSEMRNAVLEVYASPKQNPMYVDEEGCQLVGLVKVDIDPKGDINSKFLVKMIFGGTELRIEVTDVKNNIVTISSVDFIG
ncbi:heat shock 70 kDa protein 12A-like isoform X2 [Dreissena polymorpha]|uniref:heat shock 70 kDa protein 12A-like isoform X2 n=1 Tax=Dreissena polymorpha TaxID=45954 RepID=UPI002263B79C|nr:heat shock 70 kDa protein 12A-like isoform X2 [Dreissena polymorpha]